MADAEFTLLGRIFNWRPRDARRAFRERLITDMCGRYFERYLTAVEDVSDAPAAVPAKPETIFSLWLQGEQNAPPLIRACSRSVRHNCPDHRFVMLDERSVFDYIELPGAIIDKRKNGRIGHAHFADIVRVELLHNYGGIWLDATCFVTGPVPQFIEDQYFFVYMAGDIFAFSFIQNCFIRARKGAFLLDAWRAMIHDYWLSEPDAFTYFMHQLLFKTLVQNNLRAAEHLSRMPHIDQSPTHAVWWSFGEAPFDKELFDSLTDNSFFQKTAYNSPWAKNPPTGSFADEMINRMYE